MEKRRTTRREAREKLDSLRLSVELVKAVRCFFPAWWICSGKSTIPGTKATSPIGRKSCWRRESSQRYFTLKA